ncbi:hypothetical protein IT6_00220 [Methylacidiphilum caldifontis]|uniref:hypothetical protein n=1 Tax=Methylacidiphilum caldifontis TaxID=2795386 RepID=UPI001A8C7776|nr:hypothetical protein [Methylacidiphilum caldifontis]QSR88776.1 hypothetical protein IT6_00220 [Methylacidiphilum caldifontis]
MSKKNGALAVREKVVQSGALLYSSMSSLLIHGLATLNGLAAGPAGREACGEEGFGTNARAA